MKKSIDDYFQSARDWSDDIYVETVASRNRYRFAFIWCLLIISIFLLAFVLLLPLQRTQFLLIHHMEDGTSWSELYKPNNFKPNRAQIESDLVRYVVNRESYSVNAYGYHYKLINLMSDTTVARQYQNDQSAKNINSPINRLKKRYIKKVHVQNVIFLRNTSKQKLAQVNFQVTRIDLITGRSRSQSMMALISWQYKGMPRSPEDKWMDWNGFMVTHYSTQQRNL